MMAKPTAVESALDQLATMPQQIADAAEKVLRYGNGVHMASLCHTLDDLRHALVYLDARVGERLHQQMDSRVADELIRESAEADGDGE